MHCKLLWNLNIPCPVAWCRNELKQISEIIFHDEIVWVMLCHNDVDAAIWFFRLCYLFSLWTREIKFWRKCSSNPINMFFTFDPPVVWAEALLAIWLIDGCDLLLSGMRHLCEILLSFVDLVLSQLKLATTSILFSLLRFLFLAVFV